MDKQDPIKEFYTQRSQRISGYSDRKELIKIARHFENEATKADYEYNFDWLGRPIIQMPQDIVALQEVVWRVKPDLIIEVGIAHGGSLILSASMLALLDLADASENHAVVDPRKSRRKVLGIDIDIRDHNRKAIETHPLSKYIEMIQGSSIDNQVIERVQDYAKKFKIVLICLDSNHTHDHVFAELQAYASLVSKDSYCIVFDSNIEDLPEDSFPDRPWGKGNNPKTAIWKYLEISKNFEIDESIQRKLLITVAPDGYLRRVK